MALTSTVNIELLGRVENNLTRGASDGHIRARLDVRFPQCDVILCKSKRFCTVLHGDGDGQMSNFFNSHIT